MLDACRWQEGALAMAGPLHLLKLCVGAESVEDLTDWHARNRAHWPAGRTVHVTRMWPRREGEVLGGGSLYWVIKGLILCRQRILALEQVDEGDGITRCALVLDSLVVRTEPSPRRPFQGWRYLAAAEAPRDLAPGRTAGGAAEPLPAALARAMDEIGLR
jgi:hypothetical protein